MVHPVTVNYNAEETEHHEDRIPQLAFSSFISDFISDNATAFATALDFVASISPTFFFALSRCCFN